MAQQRPPVTVADQTPVLHGGGTAAHQRETQRQHAVYHHDMGRICSRGAACISAHILLCSTAALNATYAIAMGELQLMHTPIV
jgi:hypothetical protein